MREIVHWGFMIIRNCHMENNLETVSQGRLKDITGRARLIRTRLIRTRLIRSST